MVMLRKGPGVYKGPQLVPTRAPRGVAPSNEKSVTERFAKVALDRGMDTAYEKGGEMFEKYGKPLASKAWTGAKEIFTNPAQAAFGGPTGLETLGTGELLAEAGGEALAKTGLGAITNSGAAAAASPFSTALTSMGSGLGAMGTAAMASPLAPIVGGFALAKMLGLFSGGGHVGPLSAAQYKDEGGQVEGKDTGTKVLEEIEEQLNRKKAAQEDKSYLLPSFKSIGGPISKLEYKSAGGETYKLSYGGGPLSKGA